MQRIKAKLWRRSSRSVGLPAATATTTAASAADMSVYSVSSAQLDAVLMCKLCLSDVLLTDTYRLSTCSCCYCTKCTEQYISLMILEGNILSISCPDALCKKAGYFTPAEIDKLTDKKTFARYKRLKFEQEVELDPLRTFCPEVGCNTICHVCLNVDETTTSDPNSKAKPVCCPTCSLVFCSMCKAKWHMDQTCDEVMRSGRKEDEGIPFACNEEANIKRCPLCHVPIERNDGCAQMMCKRCKHVFCWYCLTSLDDDFLLRHYDKGPCKNKLGHSRASVIWHRTQVVGIFAGFGILLLMASPFLLLAAPCILCCKCKVCKCCDDDDSIGSPDALSSS